MVTMDGSGLVCFHLTMVAALGSLPRVCNAPSGVHALVPLLANFLDSNRAAVLCQTLSGHTLERIAAGAGMTMKQLAATVRKAGTVTGLGGTEMGIAISEMFSVSIFYWQPLGKGRFKLVDLQRPTTKPRGLVHAEWIPVSMLRFISTLLVPEVSV